LTILVLNLIPYTHCTLHHTLPQAKRNWTSSIRTLLGTSLPSSELLSPTPEDIQNILAECVVAEEHEHNTVKEVSSVLYSV
jgi:hypothetical protein